MAGLFRLSVGERPYRLHLSVYATSEDEVRLLRRPRPKADLDLTLDLAPELEFSLRGQYVVDVGRLTGSRVNNPDYAVFFLSASYRMRNQLTLFARVDNVFDNHYEPVEGFQAAQRTAYIGIRFQNGECYFGEPTHKNLYTQRRLW